MHGSVARLGRGEVKLDGMMLMVVTESIISIEDIVLRNEENRKWL